MGLSKSELNTIAHILSSTNHSKGSKDIWTKLFQNKDFHAWWLAHGQQVVTASQAGTTRLDSAILALAAYRLRGNYGSINSLAHQLDVGLEHSGGWIGALNHLKAGFGNALFKSSPLKGYKPTFYATQGGGQASGLPAGISNHDFTVYWGQVNDVYQTWLGRKATHGEAAKAFKSGISWHALQQQLIMSKEFTHTRRYQQASDYYGLINAQLMGDNYKLKPKQIQSFLAHNYSAGDFRAWVYRHPTIYEHSNKFRQNRASLVNQFIQMFGYDPTNSQGPVKEVKTQAQAGAKAGPGTGPKGNHPGGTNNNPGGPGVVETLKPMTSNLVALINHAARNFQTPDQFAALLRHQSFYGASLEAQRIKPGQEATYGLGLNSQGRHLSGSAPATF